jgi:DNA-binding NarL/FixJ family response regulator
MINVFIGDDHPLIIDAIKTYLKDIPDINVIGDANSGEEVLEKLKNIHVDVLLLDYSFGENKMDGLEVCEYVEEHFSSIRTIVISSYQELSLIEKFIDAGAVGYVTKDATKDEYIEVIREVFDFGNKGYSRTVKEILRKRQRTYKPKPLELEVLKLIAKGKSTEEIANILHRTHFAIDERRSKILEKYKLAEGDDVNMNSLIHVLTKRGLL